MDKASLEPQQKLDKMIKILRFIGAVIFMVGCALLIGGGDQIFGVVLCVIGFMDIILTPRFLEVAMNKKNQKQ